MVAVMKTGGGSGCYDHCDTSLVEVIIVVMVIAVTTVVMATVLANSGGCVRADDDDNSGASNEYDPSDGTMVVITVLMIRVITAVMICIGVPWCWSL